MQAACHIHIRFIHAYLLDVWGEVVEYVHHPFGIFAIQFVVAGEEYRFRREKLFRRAERHRGLHSIGPRLIVRTGHNAALATVPTNTERFTSQFRMKGHLHRGKEAINVQKEDCAHRPNHRW